MKPHVLPFERPSTKDLIAILRRKLEQAERGEIVSFAMACEYADGGNDADFAIDDSASAYKLLGIVEKFKLRLAARIE